MFKKQTERVWGCFLRFLDKGYNSTVFVVLTVYFINNYVKGLLKGGRWDLYQAIATADRFLNGQGFYYSATEASTPYFPGVSFLAVVIGNLFYPWRDYILLAIASLIGTMFMYALINIGRRLSGNKWISLLIPAFFMFAAFPSYRSYMNEFKADSAVLLIGFVIVCIINKMEYDTKKVNIPYLFILFTLALVMNVTKQQALYVDMGLGSYLLFTRKFPWKNKIKLLGTLVFAGIVSLVVIFSIPDITIHTITNLNDMPYWSLKSIIHQMRACFIKQWPFFLLLFLFFILLIAKKIKLDSFGSKWILIAIVFGIGQIAGGLKIGGNDGNYEVGMVTFMPFVIVAATYLLEHYIMTDKINDITASLVGILGVGLLLMTIRVIGYRIPSVVEKIRSDKEASEYLSENFNGEKIMYYSDQYMQIARSSVIPGMDVYSVPGNSSKYFDDIDKALENRTYQYLYIMESYFSRRDADAQFYFNYKSHNAEYLQKYYEMLNDLDMPSSLQGQLYKAK